MAFTTAPVRAGAERLPVASNDGFKVGDLIAISAGSSKQEMNEIVAIGSASLILRHPLKFEHSAGAAVSRIPHPEVIGTSTRTLSTTQATSSLIETADSELPLELILGVVSSSVCLLGCCGVVRTLVLIVRDSRQDHVADSSKFGSEAVRTADLETYLKGVRDKALQEESVKLDRNILKLEEGTQGVTDCHLLEAGVKTAAVEVIVADDDSTITPSAVPSSDDCIDEDFEGRRASVWRDLPGCRHLDQLCLGITTLEHASVSASSLV